MYLPTPLLAILYQHLSNLELQVHQQTKSLSWVMAIKKVKLTTTSTLGGLVHAFWSSSYIIQYVHTSLYFNLHFCAAVFNKEEDIGTYTIKAVDDPRTLNKILYLRPPKNIYSFNDVIALWEKKIGKTLEKIYVSEDKLLRDIEGWYI